MLNIHKNMLVTVGKIMYKLHLRKTFLAYQINSNFFCLLNVYDVLLKEVC